MKNGLTVSAYRAADDERAVVVVTNQASEARSMRLRMMGQTGR